MTHQPARRDRPSLRETLSAAAVAMLAGAIAALTVAPVTAAPVRPEIAQPDPLAPVSTNGPAWIVSPRAARPGEVVHVRLKFTPTFDATGKPITPQVLFAFLNDIRHPVQGRLYQAEGTFGVDLLVPPGTDWGNDPIVWGTADVQAAILTPSRFLLLTARNAAIPFVASRSAQPPLWNR